MNTLQAYLDHRESAGSRKTATGQASRARETWATMGQSPEQRLLAFDRWCCTELAALLQWPADETRKAKLIAQCRVEIEALVLDLWRRGWGLDGKQLAAHVTKALDQVATAQREERVKDFWPFFRHVIRSYVGANAEEIQREARKTPTVGGLLATMGVTRRLQASAPSIPELIALRKDETLRSKLSKARAQERAAATTTNQLPLL
jgi:hypothetical protein